MTQTHPEEQAGCDDGPGSTSGLRESRLAAASMCMAPKHDFPQNVDGV